MDAPSRRDALRLAGAGLAAALGAGCLGRTDAGGPGGSTDTTTDRTTTTTTTDLTTENTDDTKREHVVVENRSGEEHLVAVEVLQDGETLLSRRYRVPGETGIRVTDPTFAWGEYTARGRLDGGEWRERSWEPRSCATTPHPDGNVNLGAVVEKGGEFSLVQNGCDYLKIGEHYVGEYEPAEEYRVEGSTTTSG